MPDSPPGSAGDRPRWYWAAMAAVFAVALLLRWWRLGEDSLWFDEAYAAWAAGLSPGRLIEVVRVDNSPPVFYLLLHAWTRLFGESEWALRAPSAIAATATLPLAAVAARRVLADRRAEVAAMAVFAVSWLAVRYAHEARGYALMGLFGAIAALGLTDPRPRRGVGLTILGLSGMTWVHNMAWLYVPGFAAAMLLWPGQSLRRRVLTAAAVVAAVVVLYLPWAATLLAQVKAMGGGFWIPRPDPLSAAYMLVLIAGAKISTIAVLLKQYAGGVQPGLFVVQALTVASMLTLIALAFRADRPRLRRVAAVLVAALFPVVAAYAVSVYGASSVFTPKAFVASAALLPIALATGTRSNDRPAPRWLALGAMCVVAGISLTSVVAQLMVERKEDWRGLHAHLTSLPQPNRLIVFAGNGGVLGLEYYERRTGIAVGGDRLGVPGGFHQHDPPRAMQRVRSEADVAAVGVALDRGGYDAVLLVATHAGWSDPSGLTRSLLRSRLELREVWPFDGVVLEFYAPAPSSRPAGAR